MDRTENRRQFRCMYCLHTFVVKHNHHSWGKFLTDGFIAHNWEKHLRACPHMRTEEQKEILLNRTLDYLPHFKGAKSENKS